MITRETGGMVEFIPSPEEKRERLIHRHVFDLLENLHRRVSSLETAGGLSGDEGLAFDVLLGQIRIEEARVREAHG